jgi:hypothetical protein
MAVVGRVTNVIQDNTNTVHNIIIYNFAIKTTKF